MNRTRLASRPSARGFTLIELLVTVAIAGILAAIAFPSYTSYLVKGNRSAAQSHLSDLALAETQFMADNRSYATTVSALSTSTPAAVSKYYSISFTVLAGPPSTFTITATPIPGSRQANDGALTIDSAGAKTPSNLW